MAPDDVISDHPPHHGTAPGTLVHPRGIVPVPQPGYRPAMPGDRTRPMFPARDFSFHGPGRPLTDPYAPVFCRRPVSFLYPALLRPGSFPVR